MVSEAQKKARNKYDLKSYKVLGCKVRNDIAEQFQEYCKQNETTVNAEFMKTINQCLNGCITIELTDQLKELEQKTGKKTEALIKEVLERYIEKNQ